MASLKEQVKCRWREFRREPSAFFWVIFMPILWMVVLGFAFSKPRPETYGIGWIAAASQGSGESLSLRVEERLKQDAQLKVKTGSAEDLAVRMKRGEISLIVRAPAEGSFVYELDASNPEAQRAKSYVDDIVQSAAGRQDPVPAETAAVSVEGGRYVDFLIPGLLGLSIMSSSLFGVGMTLVSNRKENLLKRYLATPMRPHEFILSHIMGRLIILAAEFLAVMAAGFLIFRFQVYGSWLAYAFFAVLGAGAFTGIALLCAARTRSIAMISGLTNIISLPMMMLSGVFFSKNNFPDWLIQLTNFLPLTALKDGLRKIALEGLPLSELGFEAAVLAFYLVVCSLLSQRLFKWY